MEKRYETSKDTPWFLQLPSKVAILGNQIKVESKLSGRDDLVKILLEALVAVKMGQPVPKVIDEMRQRRQEYLAKQ